MSLSYPEPDCIKDGNSDYQAQRPVIWTSQMGNEVHAKEKLVDEMDPNDFDPNDPILRRGGNVKFSDADAKKVRPLCKACVYGEDRQTSTDRHRVHRPLPTIEGQCFVVDAFACGHASHRGFKYYDMMRDGASQMIYCNFTKSRGAEDIVNAFTKLWDSNPTSLTIASRII